MAYNLLTLNRGQGYLMPPSLREWLAEGDLAWFILDAVDQMDLGEFYAAYHNDGWGAAAYDPAMMVAMLLYAYCQGIRSSRRIARALERLFVQALWLCREAGLVKLGVVALDGAKVAANRNHKAIEEEVRRMLAEAKKVDAEEDARFGPERQGDELPEGRGDAWSG